MIGSIAFLLRAVWTTLWSKDGFAAIAVVLGLSLAAGGLASWWAYDWGYAAADRQAEIDSLRTQVATKQADLDIALAAERIARDQADILADRAIQNQETVNDLSAELAARPDRAVCRLSDADRRRLLDIDPGEGGSPARPADPSIVPPARHSAGTSGR